MARQVRLWLDVLNGFPSIVIGIFVFALLVKASVPILGIGHHQSAFAGGFALSIIMLPLVARDDDGGARARAEPACARRATRSASRSGGPCCASCCRRAFGGILTGTTLAVARAAGETAPLLFTCALAGQVSRLEPEPSVNSIPLTIFQYSEVARQDAATSRRGRRRSS